MGSWRISAGDEQGSVAGIFLLPCFGEFDFCSTRPLFVTRWYSSRLYSPTAKVSWKGAVCARACSPIARKQRSKSKKSRVRVGSLSEYFSHLTSKEKITWFTCSRTRQCQYSALLPKHGALRNSWGYGGGKPNLFWVDKINRTKYAWQPNSPQCLALQPHLNKLCLTVFPVVLTKLGN